MTALVKASSEATRTLSAFGPELTYRLRLAQLILTDDLNILDILFI